VDEITKRSEVPVKQVVGKDGLRTADVSGPGHSGIRLPPGIKREENL